jgi:hypothetical protein
VLGGGVIFILLIFFGVGAGVLCSVVGFVYPAFKSFETIETKTKGDDIQWLVYWVLFAFFSLIETFRDFILYWIPFYYAFKLAFLSWAFLPQTKGAKFLYDSFLKDFLKKSESRIDAAMTESRKVRNVCYLICHANANARVYFSFVWALRPCRPHINSSCFASPATGCGDDCC